MRTIKQIHTATYSPIADLITYSPLPSRTLQQIDPFLFLNHHGPQVYPANNRGLPFGPHPHRGMETVTFIIDGDIMHKDSGGYESVITAGGVQWMTAGRGLIHAEVSSTEFKKNGGNLEILQLWLNLPSRLKMTEPFYKGLQKDEIPTIIHDNGNIVSHLVSGTWEGHKGAFDSLIDVSLCTMEYKAGSQYSVSIPASHTIFFYVIRGQFIVNGQKAAMHTLVEFNHDAEQLTIQAQEDSILLLGHAEPIGEPVIAQGPFVMNTQQEIMEAYNDYRMGKFGSWSH
ncbi:pirin family protein [Xanthocytophaga agilis]|uniref:Pirin family protein n=1 Tax=Xanthocytophaga agilis TaxID=3048010 RepID=A0AAE3UDE1_9BACT|nr:pirin family protein [Xanthocytophaga agilis]MDJ1501135.1 pirin family protein [Xanthocytophaga agilis]